MKTESDIPWDIKEELSKSKREICDVCESFLDPEHKFIVWDDEDTVFGWACAYCRSIYDMGDEVQQIGTNDLGSSANDIVGQA